MVINGYNMVKGQFSPDKAVSCLWLQDPVREVGALYSGAGSQYRVAGSILGLLGA